MDINKEVQVCEVIISRQKRRGNGNDDPIRIVTEVFTKDGTLIAENDPCFMDDKYVAMDLVHFARYVTKNPELSITNVKDWLKSISTPNKPI